MLGALRELASEHGIANVRVVEVRWPPDDVTPFRSDVALLAHVGYDIEAIGPFLEAMEAATSRSCVAILMERQPSSIADVCWPPVHDEARVALPALPEFLELLRALGRDPAVERLDRAPRRFADRAELEGFPPSAALGRTRQREGRPLPRGARRGDRCRRAGDGRPSRPATTADRHRHVDARRVSRCSAVGR